MFIRNLQSLRGVAAILIFYHHFGFDNVFAESFGDFGVTFFMMLSGFVMELAHGGDRADDTLTTGRFMLSRLVRIYPLYLLCWGLAVAFLPYRGSREGIVLSLFMLQSWVPDAEVYFAGNGVAWFISDLMFCYFMFVQLRKLSRSAAVWLTGVYFAAYFLVVLTVPKALVHGIVYISPLMQLSSFIIGMWLCRLYIGLRRSERFGRFSAGLSPLAVNVAEFVVVAVAVGAMWLYGHIPTRFSFASYWWLPVGATIMTFALTDSRPGIVGRLLNLRPFMSFGAISFSFYLLHYLAIKAWRFFAAFAGDALTGLPLIAQSVMVIVLLTAVSLLVSRYFEIPVGKKLRKLLF